MEISPLIQTFTQADSWEERYRLLIRAGKQLPPPDAQTLATMRPISGCEVNVWFKICPQTDRTFHFQAYSEARIVNGLLWLLLQRINGRTAKELKQFDLTAYFTELGIARRLSSTRLNGLKQIEGIVRTLEENGDGT